MFVYAVVAVSLRTSTPWRNNPQTLCVSSLIAVNGDPSCQTEMGQHMRRLKHPVSSKFQESR
jgi:hypothetical protein